MLSNIIVGLLTGGLSSWIVASVFYRRGRKDSEAEAALVQIDGVLLRLKQLDPKRSDSSQRSKDGVADTSHWLKCISEIENEHGHTRLGSLLETLSVKMVERLKNQPYKSDNEAEQEKKQWEASVRALRSDPIGKNV